MAKCAEHPLDVSIHEKDIAGSLRVYDLLICITGISTLIGCSFSGYLIFRHATNYTQPSKQKQIIRILLMVPVYTIACTLCIIFYKKDVYIASAYEFYESLVIEAFFLLLCQYLHLEPESHRSAFAVVESQKWIQPVRFFVMHLGGNKKGELRDGRKWFDIIWLGVFQFCLVKAFGALTKCVTQSAGVYCEESSSFSHARMWILIIELLSLIVAMICLLEFWKQTRVELAPHSPLLKFTAIKLVVFLFYLQSLVFSMLTREGGAIKPSAHFSYPSWAVGVPNALLCIELAAVSVLHLWAYPYDLYRVPISGNKSSAILSQLDDSRLVDPSPTGIGNEHLPLQLQGPGVASTDRIMLPAQETAPTSHGGLFGWWAYVDALNFMDLIQSVWRAVHWVFVQRRRNKTTQYFDQN